MTNGQRTRAAASMPRRRTRAARLSGSGRRRDAVVLAYELHLTTPSLGSSAGSSTTSRSPTPAPTRQLGVLSHRPDPRDSRSTATVVAGVFGDGQTCNVGVSFNPPNGPGSFSAQLEIPSDGSPNPLVIPLSVEVLAGPAFVASPTWIGLRGHDRRGGPKHVITITNTGDFPGGIQQAFVVGPTSSRSKPTSARANNLDPGEGCVLTARFRSIDRSRVPGLDLR